MAGSNSVVCFIIHGIGSHRPEFSVPFKQDIQRRLSSLIKKRAGKEPDKWRDVTAEGILEFRDLYWAAVGSNEQDELYRRIFPRLFEAGRFKRMRNSVTELAPFREFSVRVVGDIFCYLGKFQEEIKRTVFKGFVRELTKRVDSERPFTVIFVAHSLGSVILHDIFSGLLSYGYADLRAFPKRTSVFTMGSPLPLFSLVTDMVDPSDFRRWVNFIHRQDPIAFPWTTPSVEDVYLRAPTLAPHSVYWKHSGVHKAIAQEALNHYDGLQPIDPSLIRIPKRIPPEIFRPFHGPALDAGFSDYEADFNEIPFHELIEGAVEIDICNVYGESWYRNHAQYFARAFATPTKDVRIVMLSPDSPALQGFCHQFGGITTEDLRERIRRSQQAILGAFDAAKKSGPELAHLRIYESQNIINHSFYRFDNLVYLAPRPLSTSKHAATPIPAIVFRHTDTAMDMFRWLTRDLGELLGAENDIRLVFDSRPPQPGT